MYYFLNLTGVITLRQQCTKRLWSVKRKVKRKKFLKIMLDSKCDVHYIVNMKHGTSFRLSETGLKILRKLTQMLGISQAGVVEMALRELGRKHGVEE